MMVIAFDKPFSVAADSTALLAPKLVLIKAQPRHPRGEPVFRPNALKTFEKDQAAARS